MTGEELYRRVDQIDPQTLSWDELDEDIRREWDKLAAQLTE